MNQSQKIILGSCVVILVGAVCVECGRIDTSQSAGNGADACAFAKHGDGGRFLFGGKFVGHVESDLNTGSFCDNRSFMSVFLFLWLKTPVNPAKTGDMSKTKGQGIEVIQIAGAERDRLLAAEIQSKCRLSHYLNSTTSDDHTHPTHATADAQN